MSCLVALASSGGRFWSLPVQPLDGTGQAIAIRWLWAGLVVGSYPSQGSNAGMECELSDNLSAHVSFLPMFFLLVYPQWSLPEFGGGGGSAVPLSAEVAQSDAIHQSPTTHLSPAGRYQDTESSTSLSALTLWPSIQITVS